MGDVPGGTCVDLISVNVEAQESANPIENGSPSENEQYSAGDRSLGLRHPGGDSFLSRGSNVLNRTEDGSDSRDSLTQKRDGTDSPRADALQDATTSLLLNRHSTPKVKNETAAKSKSVWTDVEMGEADESGTPEERAAFMNELETFYIDRELEFKAPKFYGEPLNCLKLWRAVIRLGGYEVVTGNKLWRQVGESFHPPKTCTTVSWTFRIFYEKALLEYEKFKRQNGELQLPSAPQPQHTIVEKEDSSYQEPVSGRARRDAAARAMQSWHSHHMLGYGEVSEPVIKDKNLSSATKHERPLKSLHKQKATHLDLSEKHGNLEEDKEVGIEIIDIGPPADWVKINVREAKDCFEVYALVPGLLREEVRVQSDPAGRLVITGQPEQLDNPWGITPFKKVVSFPSRIDPLNTSAVVSLHGRLYVRAPLEGASA